MDLGTAGSNLSNAINELEDHADHHHHELHVHFLNNALERLSDLTRFIVDEFETRGVVELEPSGCFLVVGLGHDIFSFGGFEATPEVSNDSSHI